MKEKEIMDKLKELQNDSFEWQGGEDLIDFIKNLKKENEELQKENKKLKYKVSLNELDKDYVEREFVPKDKIREKIKELQEKNKNTEEIEAVFNIKQMQILEKLLREE